MRMVRCGVSAGPRWDTSNPDERLAFESKACPIQEKRRGVRFSSPAPFISSVGMFIDDSKIALLLKLPAGQRTDDVLYYLLAPHLLGFWTFLKPKHKGQELGDVVYIFEDVCLIFEAKTREKAEPANDKWIRERLKESVNQISKNHNTLISGAVSTLRNPWRGEVSWASLGVRHFQGIIVLMHDSEPYDPRELEQLLFSAAPIPIHVISLQDLNELVRFINTPWDFIVYWEFRIFFGREYELTVHREQSIYWGILREWVKLAKVQNSAFPEAKLDEDRQFQEAYTKVMLRSETSDETIKQKVAASYLIDIAAGSLMQKADQDSSGKRIGGKKHDTLIKTVGTLVELSRIRRAEYGYTWLSCAKECITSHKDIRKNRYSPSRNRSYFVQARCNQEFNKELLLAAAAQRLTEDKSTLAIGLSATAENIIHTYESILSSMNGTNFEVDVNKILNSTTVLIDRTSMTTEKTN